MAASLELSVVKISIQDQEDPVIFSNLSVFQSLADVCSFVFQFHPAQSDRQLSSHVDFIRTYIGKDVTIAVRDEFTFSGIVQSIQANTDDTGVTVFEFSGQGQYAKVDELAQCRTFEEKNLEDIFKALLPKELPAGLNTAPAHKDAIPYVVQYNQTVFECCRMLAARYGEWLWYDGQALNLSTPTGDVAKMVIGQDLQQVNIGATIHHAQDAFAGFDYKKGETISSDKSIDNSKLGALAKAAMDAGAAAFGHEHNTHHLPQAAYADQLNRVAGAAQKTRATAAVSLTATSRDSTLNLCRKISVTDADGYSAGDFVITAITHSAEDDHNYTNYIIAVPTESEVSPATNVDSYLSCQPLVGVITDNEDENGTDYVRVHFPWQEEGAKTPWIPVAVPHAGKDKGFRFLPEIGDEVLLDFINGNPERPYVVGAIYTEARKSGSEHKGNHIKMIGTASGRRLEIDDDKGTLKLYDNFTDKTPKNALLFKRKDDENNIILESQKDVGNYTVITLRNEEFIGLGVVSNDELVAEIKLNKDGKKVAIASKGSIHLSSGEITLDAGTININASDELNLKGGSKVNISGAEINASADANAKIEAGAQLELSGGATAKLSGGAMTEVTGALVKIN